MAHPKRKQSKSRRDKRRTHYKITAPNVVNCTNCSSPVLWHRVCGECGYYRGKPAIQKTAVSL